MMELELLFEISAQVVPPILIPDTRTEPESSCTSLAEN